MVAMSDLALGSFSVNSHALLLRADILLTRYLHR